MILIAFRCRPRQGVEADLERAGMRMYELASQMPGFVSYKDYTAADGENVALVEFESLETLQAWRDHPEHVEIQRRAREEFFTEYHIQVCNVVRDYGFP
jgi:heme-degrading monooxygenase HmoA